MVAILKSAPTASAFAEAWAEHLVDPGTRAVYGKDKRLSPSEAARAMDETEGPVSLVKEALEPLRVATGRSRAGIRAMREAAVDFAESEGSAVTGADGKISFDDAKNLPPVLQRGYLFLRGRTPETPTPSGDDQFGVISDIDKTVMPPAKGGVVQAPYPGVAVLYKELDLAKDHEADATWYVTARTAERAADVPEWLEEYELPSMGIETGISPMPWVAEPEKVSDILGIMDANPGKRFVLFGDSNHRDPEVYRAVREARPDQVEEVFIHKVNPTVDEERVEGMKLITEYTEAAAVLYKKGLLSKSSARKVFAAARAGGVEISKAEENEMLKK